LSEAEYEFDWEMPLGLTAGIFVALDWKYDIPGVGIGHPNAEVIQAVVEGLLEAVIGSEEGSFATIGRIMVLRDPETPSSYDFYLKLGHVYPPLEEAA
jgi:hypothetical protein